MTNPFLEAFQVGYAIASDKKGKNARATMFEATGEAESILSELASGAVPAENYQVQLDRLNSARAKWLGAASATDMTYAEFKTDAAAWGQTDAKIADYALGIVERTWGTPTAAEAARGWASVLNVKGDVSATFDNGHLVLSVTEEDGDVRPIGAYTQEQITGLRLTAQQGGFNSAMLSEDLARKAAETAETQANTALIAGRTEAIPTEIENTQAATEYTKAQTEALPIETAIKGANAETAARGADNAYMAQLLERGKAGDPAAIEELGFDPRLADTKNAAGYLKEITDPEAISALEMAGGAFSDLLAEDRTMAIARAAGMGEVVAKYKPNVTAAELGALVAADLSPADIAGLLQKRPDVTVAEILDLFGG